MPKCAFWLASCFNAEAAAMYPMWGRVITLDNSQTQQVLGINFTPVKQSVLEMSETLIETGYVPQPKPDKNK